MKETVREIEVEVLPKDGGPAHSESKLDDPLIEFIARLMDSAFKIPGTEIRFGLDPLMGLIPGLGSSISAFISLFLIVRSAQYRVPNSVLARMALNVLINAGLDSIPVLGDTLSVFFRSNALNYELLRKYANPATPASSSSRRRGTLLIVLIIAVAVPVLLLAVTGFLFLAAKLTSWVNGK